MSYQLQKVIYTYRLNSVFALGECANGTCTMPCEELNQVRSATK
jgi:hypothetical protein